MSEKELTFNDLPSAVAYLIQSVDEIKAMLKHLPPRSSVNEEWLGVEQLIQYLPDKPAKATIYSWSAQGIIPSHRVGKRLGFKISEIDDWILGRTNSRDACHQGRSEKRPKKKKGGRHE